MDRKFINPRYIKEDMLFPLVVLSDDRRGFLGWGIKMHSGGNYNHIMEMHKPNRLASQGWLFKEVMLNIYLKPHIMLKFWTYKPLTKKQRQSWIDTINTSLKAPWWRRGYDFLGILGQCLRMPWINNPWKRYCSERVAEHLRKGIGLDIPKKLTPSGLNEYFKKHKDWQLLGYWWND